MKKRIGIIVMLCLIIGLSGCGLMSNDNLVDKQQEPITLRMTWWGNEIRNKATIQVIRMYEQQNPHVRIEFEHTGFNEYWKKLAPYAAGNTIPDIIQMDISYLAQYSSLNLLENLLPYIQKGLIDSSHISADTIASGTIDDKVYGFSLGVNALFAAYDPEVLEENGIEPPANGWTWDELEDMGKQLLGTDTYLGTSLTPEHFFSYFLRQHGRTLFAADGTKLGYEDDKLFIEYFGRMQRLVEDKLFFPPDIWTPDVKSSFFGPFLQGKSFAYLGIFQSVYRYDGRVRQATQDCANAWTKQ